MGRGGGEGPMGTPREEMFAMDTPELKEVEEYVDLLVDSLTVESDDVNALQNEPSDEPEEELGRTHKDIAGYGDPEDKANEYPPGGKDETGIEDEPEEDLYGHGGMGMGEQLEGILKEHPYNDFFRSMMDKEGISGLKGLSAEKKSAFFKKVGAEWKVKKK